MLKTALMGMTVLALLTMGTAADWLALGDVQISHHRDRVQTGAQFSGPVESLRFIARGSDLDCRAITAEYGDGEKQQLFSGRLYRDRPVSADVRGREQRVEKLSMTCDAASRSGGLLEIAADAGRLRMAWEKSKQWASRLARDFERNAGVDSRPR